MKGIIGNQKGILLPYEEYCEKIGLPEGYLLEDVGYHGGDYLYFTLIEKNSFELRDGLVLVPNTERTAYLRKTKEEINKKLGTQFEHPCHYFCFKTKGNGIERFHYGDRDRRMTAFAHKDRNIYVWISSQRTIYNDEEEFFIETK